MMKIFAIGKNTFMQAIRQPVYCIIILITIMVLVLDLPLSGWSVGVEYEKTNQKMLENLGLSTLLLAGLLVAAFAACNVVTREIRDRTALTVVSKPVSRVIFILGKFAGVAAATAVAYYLCSIVFLMTVRHQVVPTASSPIDWPVIVIGVAAFVLTILTAMIGNLLFGWTFTSSGVFSALAYFTLAALLVAFIGKGWQVVPPGYDTPPVPKAGVVRVEFQNSQDLDALRKAAAGSDYDIEEVDTFHNTLTLRFDKDKSLDAAVYRVSQWPGAAEASAVTEPPVIYPQLLIGVLLLFLADLLFVAVAVAAGARLGPAMTLMVCFAVLFVGSIHPYIFDRWSQGNIAALVLSWVVPNLTYFYVFDAITADMEIPLWYAGLAGLYCLGYAAAVLAVGVGLFQTRELTGEGGGGFGPAGTMAWIGKAAAVAMLVAAVIIAFVPAYHTFAGIALIGGLVIAAALTWLFWSYFAGGARWSYWLAVVLSGAVAAGSITLAVAKAYYGWGAERIPEGPWPVVAAAVSVCALVLLFLPGTRRHFKSSSAARIART